MVSIIAVFCIFCAVLPQPANSQHQTKYLLLASLLLPEHSMVTPVWRSRSRVAPGQHQLSKLWVAGQSPRDRLSSASSPRQNITKAASVSGFVYAGLSGRAGNRRGYDFGMDITRETLYQQVWSEPLRTLARCFGLSDVGLKKICRRHDIPTPGLGYWAKVEHGKPVEKILMPPAPRGTPAVLSIRTREEQKASDVRRACVVEQWIDRENLPEFQIAAPPPSNWRHALSIATEKSLRKAKPHTGGWLVAPPGCLAVRISSAMLPRALAIMDAVVTACEARGWPVTTEFQMPRRLGWNGTFWYPGRAWVTTLPPQPRALTGVGLLQNHVWFSIREVSQMGPPSPEEIRAHHIASFPGAVTRRRDPNRTASCCSSSIGSLASTCAIGSRI